MSPGYVGPRSARTALEPQLVFQRNGKRDDEVYGGELGQQVLLSELAFSLVGVHPDQTREVLRCEC